MELIHPTAVIDPRSQIHPSVRIGPYSVLEGPVRLDEDCVVGPHVHLIGPLTVGPRCTIHAGCVIGDKPQHLGYKNEETQTIIGQGNVFRENCTIHRGMPATGSTIIGNDNFFMTGCHVAHDCRVGNKCIFANGAVLAGHAEVHNNAFMSAYSAVHQFCRVGRLVMLSGLSAGSQDIPPFWVVQGINIAVGVNVIGMRRAGMGADEIQAIRRAYKTIIRSEKTIPASLDEIVARDGHIPVVEELVTFIRQAKRGITITRRAKPQDRHD